MFGEDCWPSVRVSFGLAGEEVRFLTCLEDGMYVGNCLFLPSVHFRFGVYFWIP